jgi:hypothetical protein
VTFERYEWRARNAAALVDEFGVLETPTFVVIDGAGRVVANQSGMETRESLSALIQRAQALAR